VDIARRAGLGFAGAARQIGLGVLEGLRQAGNRADNDERPLSWAPDFTEEARITVLRQFGDLGIEGKRERV
jgi:hypothetical protein